MYNKRIEIRREVRQPVKLISNAGCGLPAVEIVYVIKLYTYYEMNNINCLIL